jgi:hypothetical protein
MAGSEGYDVGDHRFPAVAVDSAAVRSGLAPVAHKVEIHPIELGDAPLRAGYHGMLVATGRAAIPDH